MGLSCDIAGTANHFDGAGLTDGNMAGRAFR
jgi:hypothetical protein